MEIDAFVESGRAISNALPVPIGATARVRFVVTNVGAAKDSARYLLVLNEPGALEVLGAEHSRGELTISPPDSAMWEVNSLEPQTSAVFTVTVRMHTPAAVRIDATRVDAAADAPGNSAVAILDGVGAAPTGGRWIAAGNVDGVPGDEIVTGTGEAETAQVSVYSGAGAPLGPAFAVFSPPFRGGVRVASCDIDGDGRDEIVAAQGPGGSRVRLLRLGASGLTAVGELTPFEATFAGGVFVACADVDGDSLGDLIVGAGAGRAPEVRVYAFTSGSPLLVASFLAFASSFTGGVRVSAADLSADTGDPHVQIVTASGPGRPLAVAIWQLAAGHAQEVGRSATFWPEVGGGAAIALGDADGNGQIDLFVAPDGGHSALLRVYSLATRGVMLQAPSGAASLHGGGRFAMSRHADGQLDIVVADGPGGMPRVQTFRWAGSALPIKRSEFLALEIPPPPPH